MVKQLLGEINKIDGVAGVFIATNRSEIANKVGLKFNDEQLSSLATHTLRMIAGFHLKNKKVTEVEFYWQNQYIICKNSEHFMLVAFCKTSRILSFLRITLNVTTAKLMENKKFNKWLKSHIADQDFVLRKGLLDTEEEEFLQKLS